MSRVVTHIQNLALLGLLTLLLTICSKPTAPGINPQVVLRRMLGFPAISFPPETEENATDYGFITTKEYCQFLVDIRKPFKTWIQVLLDENIPAVQEEHSYTVGTGDTTFTWTTLTWTRMYHDGESKFVLEVKLKPKLDFGMEWIGPAYETLSPKALSGWIIPDEISGYVHDNWRSLEWKPDIHSMDYNAGTESISYLIVDNLDGSGRVLVQNYFWIIIFRSEWDTLGHGSWRSATDSWEW